MYRLWLELLHEDDEEENACGRCGLSYPAFIDAPKQMSCLEVQERTAQARHQLNKLVKGDSNYNPW